MSLRIGTSGWSYDDWVGPFYDRKKGMFTNYSRFFNTSEINSTFYRYPSTRMVGGWYNTAPPGFVFALKLPQVITHDKWLRIEEGVEDDTERFLELVQPLAEKLGPILIQLRPSFNYEDHLGVLEEYLETLPGNYHWAVEFRHLSWMRNETFNLLRRLGIAYTIVDEPLLPPEVHVTADFAYIRWHGRGSRPWYNYEYDSEELEVWIPKVEEAQGKAKLVYGFFNNHFKANAVKNAVEFLSMLGQATSDQEDARKRIIEHRIQTFQQTELQPLESFMEAQEDLNTADLLIRFTTLSRLTRAEKITDEELTIKKNSDGRIEAEIRDYFIEVDMNEKVIRHNCSDWQKGLAAKRICKHTAKLFLSLPEQQSTRILSNIWEEKEKWRFE